MNQARIRATLTPRRQAEILHTSIHATLQVVHDGRLTSTWPSLTLFEVARLRPGGPTQLPGTKEDGHSMPYTKSRFYCLYRRRVQCGRVPERNVSSDFGHERIGAVMARRWITGLYFTEPAVSYPASQSWFHKAIIGRIPTRCCHKDGFVRLTL